jgi:hypothetical protein
MTVASELLLQLAVRGKEEVKVVTGPAGGDREP